MIAWLRESRRRVCHIRAQSVKGARYQIPKLWVGHTLTLTRSGSSSPRDHTARHIGGRIPCRSVRGIPVLIHRLATYACDGIPESRGAQTAVPVRTFHRVPLSAATSSSTRGILLVASSYCALSQPSHTAIRCRQPSRLTARPVRMESHVDYPRWHYRCTGTVLNGRHG